ncbi:WecB/TagA/CpsF family glycosyltransferase [Paracoccus sp. YIM 132242]|uniref:WecB/TagA/CpsF family glycosyltransferase n=1 Tax=Paracoccus lichenicola TaxID=2665644 RepID=A0A6L6HT83_9RHOB|nr:WecB/TagA/CpsF family glycosyltransferase [Paracoccus lichenicola]MTE01510.1 WecB/TagA/CpsF family glycosyltransferase [Paracoccus lichenicola]
MEFRVGGEVVRITCRDRQALLEEVRHRLALGRGFTLATLNVDHLEKLRRDGDFRQAYGAHDLVVADGNPIVWLSRVAGHPVGLAPGSELVEPLARIAAGAGAPVALVAGSDAAARGAAAHLKRIVPGLQVVLQSSPGFPFDPVGAEARALAEAIRDSGARLCFLGVGAPRQERFAAFAAPMLPQVGFASVGAGLDFLAGLQRRAPAVVRRARMEWLWRALSSPRRLGPRYVKGATILPGHLLDALMQRRAR